MNRHKGRLLIFLLIAAGIVAPMFVYPVLVMKVLCLALFASAFNLLLGYTGLLSFGHAAFFGIAAYLGGYVVKEMQFPLVGGILLGTVAAGLLGWVFGWLAIRRQGIYFAMITLALAQLVFFVFVQAPFTGGEDGLQNVPRGSLFGIDLASDINMYYLVLLIFLLGFGVIYRTIHSPFGQILLAIRENEPRAISLGYDVDRCKLIVFIISAAISGAAGATKMAVFNFATLTDAHWHMSGEVVLMTLLGGLGTVLGPLVGAGIVTGLQNILADKVGSLVTVIMGLVFIVCVLAFRRGVIGELQARLHGWGPFR